MLHSQNNESETLIKFFGDFKGVIFSAGENDGQMLSNSRDLILLGWVGILIEPAPKAFKSLHELYADNKAVVTYNFAISDKCGKVILNDSGTHLNNGDTSLLSSLHKSEIKKWEPTTEFNEVEVDAIDIDSLLKISPYKTFDLVSIDCEGCDLSILKQIDLTALEVKVVVIEHNSIPLVKAEIMLYCHSHSINNILLDNSENIILSR